ncbi:hypothetical protein [Pseudonocardia pini]|uniref:hypothetical protein n=1 Tax=Pseudonocardia pini TaxID=2758030 RepID=UPI0015EFFD06|nr:hypothetical protein [Pseudonocardia pini]
MPDVELVPFGPAAHPPRECGCLCGPECTAPAPAPAPVEVPEPRQTPSPVSVPA